jgi:hypothetical protein
LCLHAIQTVILKTEAVRFSETSEHNLPHIVSTQKRKTDQDTLKERLNLYSERKKINLIFNLVLKYLEPEWKNQDGG